MTEEFPLLVDAIYCNLRTNYCFSFWTSLLYINVTPMISSQISALGTFYQTSFLQVSRSNICLRSKVLPSVFTGKNLAPSERCQIWDITNSTRSSLPGISAYTSLLCMSAGTNCNVFKGPNLSIRSNTLHAGLDCVSILLAPGLLLLQTSC